MDAKLLEQLRKITREEQAVLEGNPVVQRNLYTSGKDFVVDSEKMLEKGKLIDIRTNTRFVHFPAHRHNYIEMIYMCAGESTHIINKSAHINLKEGDLLLLNQYVTQEILPTGHGDIAVNFMVLPEFFDRTFIMMDGDNILRDFLVSSLKQNTDDARYLFFETRDILPIQNLIENMIWSIMNKQSYKQSVNQTTMGLLFMHLMNHTELLHNNDPDQYESNIVVDVLKYIEENCRTATLEEYASEKKMHTYYLSKLLKKRTGYAFKELLQQKKMNQSVYLLKNTSLPVENIISAVGYENSSYFYRIFKEKYGVTPKIFRQQWRENM